MTKAEYERIWSETITRKQNHMTVGLINKMYDMLFHKDEPVYGELNEVGLRMLIADFECMYHAGCVDGILNVYDGSKRG